MIVAILPIVLIVRAKVSSYVESVSAFSTRICYPKNYVSTTQNVDTKNTLKNFIPLLVVNKYADEYCGYTAQEWKGLILPKRSVTADA